MTYSKNEITKRKFDVIIVGAGGSGMRASLQLARAGLNVAVLSKVFPTRSHTVAAQGGIGASLGNMSEDNWHYHFYDTIKGSDWLGDQDAIEFMCREAPKVVYDLEHMGMPFDRNPDGTIYQRPFGGHTANYGEKPVQRACAAADRTGHAMLHTLYQQNVKEKTSFFVEWMALDLIRDAEGDVVGVTALEMETGDLHILEAKTVLLATGGAGRIFAASTNAFINTGDGLGMAARAGIPLQDMEFWRIGNRCIKLGDGTSERRIDIGRCLHRFDDCGFLFGNQRLTDIRQVNENKIAEQLLRVVGNTNRDCAVGFGANPFMAPGVFEGGGDVHGLLLVCLLMIRS